MDFSNSIEFAKLLLLAFVLLFCSATDFSARRIPNSVLLPALIAALFLNSFAGGLTGLADSLAGLVMGLLMLLPLHLLGRMGAGDVKLLGVVGSILGAWGAFVAGLATMIAGAVLGLAYLLWIFIKPAVLSLMSDVAGFINGRTISPEEDPVSAQRLRAIEIPYAVAVAAGTFATLFYLDMLNGVSIS